MFSLDQFYQINRRVLIWLILFGLLWLLQDFFALIFLTFVLAFIADSGARAIEKTLRLGYKISLVVVYLIFLASLLSFVRFVVPNVIQETNRFGGNLERVQQRVIEIKSSFIEKYPGLQRPLTGYVRSTLDDELLNQLNESLAAEARSLGLGDYHNKRYRDPVSELNLDADALQRYQALEDEYLLTSFLAQLGDKLRERIPPLINVLYQGTVTLLLALLFSFLILLDYRRLRAQVEGLRNSRLRDFYAEAAHPVLRFAFILGKALQAQALIAIVNTVLTVAGLFLLGISSLAMLALIVFVCSFVPVLGVFFSTLPMVLVALNAQSLDVAIAVVAVVVLVHAIEAYLLNPLIYGTRLKLNPILVLFILLVAYHGFGIWGVILGVPVSLYLLQDVFGVSLFRQPRSANADD